MFEIEYQKQSSVEDTGFTNMLYLLNTEEGKKWHFQYRVRYSCWSKCKQDFVKYFSEFYVKKLFDLKSTHDCDKQTVQQFAQKQMVLWKRFFPCMSQTQLNTAVLSGLTKVIALQLAHYVKEDKKEFLDYCGWIDNWDKINTSGSDEEMNRQDDESIEEMEDIAGIGETDESEDGDSASDKEDQSDEREETDEETAARIAKEKADKEKAAAAKAAKEKAAAAKATADAKAAAAKVAADAAQTGTSNPTTTS